MIYKILISDREFNPRAEIQDIVTNLSWEYNRIGGCGACSFDIPDRYAEDTVLGMGFNVKISRKNPTTGVYDLWYQGRIENKNYTVNGQSEDITVQVAGYQSALADVYVDANYSSQEVSVVVKSILDNYITPNTDITYSAGDITATSFTPDTLSFNSNGLECMTTLGSIVGSREWGVDKDRNFFFKARSADVGQRYWLGDKILKFTADISSRDIVNRVIVTGGLSGGSPYTATFNDTVSQLKWKRKDKVFQNSAITTSSVASQFADSIFAEFSEIVRRAKVDILDEVLIENTIPIPLLRIIPRLVKYGQKKYGGFLYSGHVDYQVNRVQYKIDQKGNLTISMSIGQLRPTVAENISQLSYQIDQLRQQGV